MKYYNKQELDNHTIERVSANLDALQEIIYDYALHKKYRALCAEMMGELLDYYNGRLESTPTTNTEILRDEELPF